MKVRVWRNELEGPNGSTCILMMEDMGDKVSVYRFGDLTIQSISKSEFLNTKIEPTLSLHQGATDLMYELIKYFGVKIANVEDAKTKGRLEATESFLEWTKSLLQEYIKATTETIKAANDRIRS